MSLLFVIDSPHVMYRACHANAELSYERHGEVHKTGGMYGFLQMVRLAHSRLGDGDAVVVAAWEDPQRSTRSVRRLLYPAYKSKTKPEDEVDYGVIELRQFVREQQKLLAPLLTSIGIPQVYAPGWEADDVIATLCDSFPEHDVVIFSGDKDLLSLVSDRVAEMRPLKEGYQLITPGVWAEEHTVPVDLWPQVLALAGDDADNIPGVRGIGYKTAEKLLGAHGGLDGVLSAAAAGQIKRFSKAISDMEEQIRLNLKLTTLNRQVDLIWTQPLKNEEEVERKFREMKFYSFTGYDGLQSIMEMGVGSW